MIQLITEDCLSAMRKMADDSVDLIVTSPPYEAARKYGELQFNLQGQEWVDWAAERYIECNRICKGLVCWVVEGRTQKFQWSATPALLMADLHRAGIKLRKPPIYKRNGIPGSGGPDWLRNEWEFIVCSSKGRLPWSSPSAMGKPPKYGAGGPPSHRLADGTRVNGKPYKPPPKSNSGNIIDVGAAGGGNIGSKLAHETEAPFAEYLAEFLIRSFCPRGGTVLDCFGGSGTTASQAVCRGRHAISIDIRHSQTELTKRRIAESV